jgi:hypothetical protein
MQFWCFLGFLCVVICAVAVSFIATCVLLVSRVYVCVCPGKVALWLLILVWFVCGHVYFDLFRFYLLSIIIFNFVCSWDTRQWIKSKNTIRLILIHHRQNPTKMTPIQWVAAVLSWGEQLGHEAYHSPSSAKVKKVWSYTLTPPVCLHGVILS